MTYAWLSDPDDARHVDALRDQVEAEAASVLIFLGAGLSFGVGRFLGRAAFERPEPWDRERFPSWPDLMGRMKDYLAERAESDAERRSYEAFFRDNDYLDCAQLFRMAIGIDEYETFLVSQFGTTADDADVLTPAHAALVRLPVTELFTTNYDSLIELAFTQAGEPLVVSANADEFRGHQVERPPKHLVKLHGTIDRPSEIVLTRDDYARSRRARAEMFEHLTEGVRYSSFLFLGFSLTDPNFNIVRDDARAVMHDHMPTSYLVQQRPDRVMVRYLTSLGVETVGLENWNWMPALLEAISPAS